MADCTIPFEICRLRATRLDDLGNVAAGPNNYWVTDKVTEVQINAEIETGDDRVLKGGCGCIIATAKLPDLRKRWTLQITKGSIEPGLEEIMLGDTVIVGAGSPIGVWTSPQIGAGCPQPPNVAIEVWAKNWLFDHQDPTYPWIEFLFVQSQWQRGQQTLNDDLALSPVAGFTRGNDLWGHGPYAVQPEAVPSGADGGYWFTATDPPAANCAYGTISPSS